MVTIGTGLGYGVFQNGMLIPTMELSQIFHTNREPIEFFAADSARKREGLKLEEWAERFNFAANSPNAYTRLPKLYGYLIWEYRELTFILFIGNL